MVDFHIRGRIEVSGPSRFAVIVVAIPSVETEPFRKMQDTCAARGLAVQRLRELTVAMGKTIRAEGGSILDVVTDE